MILNRQLKIKLFIYHKLIFLKNQLHILLWFSINKYAKNYKIDGTKNLARSTLYKDKKNYPYFQDSVINFQELIKSQVLKKESKSYYKFGDGDYYFLHGIPTGSAKPGNRALSKKLSEADLAKFRDGANKCDYYMCELENFNNNLFKNTIYGRTINFPAEIAYGLIANRWLTKNFSGQIGIIGADAKLELIAKLLEHNEYKEYLGINNFRDFIKIPQKYACDDLESRIADISAQIRNSNSEIFLIGIGHLKSGLLHLLPKVKNAVYLDVGSGIDALAGLIDRERPYFGKWTNFRIHNEFDYTKLDLLQFNSGKIKNL